MTDAPLEPSDAPRRTPVTHYGKASLSLQVVMTTRGRVEKLIVEGASEQAIIEAIRQESPEIADVVEANPAPRGWSSHQWLMFILALYVAVLHTYKAVHADTSLAPQEEIREIRQILEEVLPMLQVVPRDEDPTDRAGGGGPASTE